MANCLISVIQQNSFLAVKLLDIYITLFHLFTKFIQLYLAVGIVNKN